MKDGKSFLATLFDFSFSQFVTLKIIPILYGLWTAGAAIAALVVIGAGFNQGVAAGVLALIFSPVIFCLYVLMGRILFESTIVLFRIAENTRRMAKAADGGAEDE